MVIVRCACGKDFELDGQSMIYCPECLDERDGNGEWDTPIFIDAEAEDAPA